MLYFFFFFICIYFFFFNFLSLRIFVFPPIGFSFFILSFIKKYFLKTFYRMNIVRQLFTGIVIMDFLFSFGYGQRFLYYGGRFSGKRSYSMHLISFFFFNGVYISLFFSVRKNEIMFLLAKTFWNSLLFFYNSKNIFFEKFFSSLFKIKSPFILNYLMQLFVFFFWKNGLMLFDGMWDYSRIYRQYSITVLRRIYLLKRFYPLNLFYLHASLLENFFFARSDIFGMAWMSALCTVESYNDDYIVFMITNLISITDGQLSFNVFLKIKNEIPFDLFRCLTRLGDKAVDFNFHDIFYFVLEIFHELRFFWTYFYVRSKYFFKLYDTEIYYKHMEYGYFLWYFFNQKENCLTNITSLFFFFYFLNIRYYFLKNLKFNYFLKNFYFFLYLTKFITLAGFRKSVLFFFSFNNYYFNFKI